MKNKKPTTLNEGFEHFKKINAEKLEQDCKHNNELYEKYFTSKK